ncbi:hypothetical protein JQ628_29360 [Bradyrhizobium lablabi]|uniref:hypothetical protein n=1 Tax=Bradyrhizobium lablabi TaxID=722472 RepID=UPI001BAC7E9B|nr:hypothetical protein [Bradyrhizobium lablabi]MBR1125663.1 hypothetical protein [Bradyrhizobium lablabi]
MRKITLCVGLAIASASLSAAAAFETRATRLQAIKTVGIISAMGDEISMTRAGLTPLNNRIESVPVQSWKLDDLIVQQATALMSRRFQVQTVGYPRGAFAAVKESAIGPVNLARGDPFKVLVRRNVLPQGLDAYIVITRAKSTLGTGRKVEGLGFAQYRTLLASYGIVHALYEVRVIDGKTFDVIDKRAASPLGNTEMIRLAGPSRTVEGTFEGADSGEQLRAAIVDLLTRSLSVTLTDMHLAGAP